MKKSGLLLLICTLIISCSTQNNSLAKNEELVQKYVNAVELNDAETIKSILADNYPGLGPSVGDSINKTSTIENWKYNLENLYESIHYDKSRIISVNVPDGENKGAWVSNWAQLTILYKSGEQAVIWANSVYQIENKQIVKSYTFYNEADVYEQLGFVFYKKKIIKKIKII